MCDTQGACRGTITPSCSTPGAPCVTTTPFPAPFDIAVATLDIRITRKGQPFPTTGNDNATNRLWTVAKDTGARHEIAHWLWSSGSLTMTHATMLVPGTYDILFDRGGDEESVAATTSIQAAHPNAWRLVDEDVVFSAGSNALTIDIPSAALTFSVSSQGQPLPTVGYDNATNRLWAVARDIGSRHEIARWLWSSGSLNMTHAHELVPGTYDILFDRGGSAGHVGYSTSTQTAHPNAWRLIGMCVEIP